ncbi:MAG: sugar transferase [Acutalibacteraceae bacterium]|jgi:O-antigen biosynthesis protein WbqP
MKLKRFLDIVFAVFFMILLAPLMALLSLIVIIDDGFPVIYEQERVGRYGKIFIIKKFRTMKKNTREAATRDLTESGSVITRSGKFLRKTSLDELPQIENILKGEMSFVGPRPLIKDEKDIHQLRKEAGVYAVRPGITGLAQISGRDNVSPEAKAEFDRQYVENWNLWGDFKIVLKTFTSVLKREGIVDGANNDEAELKKNNKKDEDGEGSS